MYILSLSTVPEWINWDNKWIPKSCDTICPHCGRLVNLPLERHNWDHLRETVSATARCPGCGKTTFFWIVKPGDGRDSTKRGCELLCIYPRPRVTREPIVSPEKLSNTALARAYQSAISAYNAGLWDACATSCRKTLEGLVHSLLPPDKRKGSLFEQLRTLPDNVNLSEPLILIADSLRKGGNIGAHFDLEKSPEQTVAALMLDLLDYFMEYLYVLKEQAQELEKKLDLLGK
jgi:hypothetical protein